MHISTYTGTHTYMISFKIVGLMFHLWISQSWQVVHVVLKTASYHSIELSNGNIWKVSSFSSEGCPWKVPHQSCYITSYHISSYPVCLICFSLFSALIPRRTGVNEPHSGGIQDCQRDILAVYKLEGDRESFRFVAVTLKEIRTLPNKWKFLLERWLFIYLLCYFW